MVDVSDLKRDALLEIFNIGVGRAASSLSMIVGDEVLLSAPISRGRRDGAVRGFLANTERAAGGLPLRRMPAWLRPVVGWLMPRIGPRGLEFARARLEMKAIATALQLRREAPAKLKSMVPAHVWALVARHGLHPAPGEEIRESVNKT